MCDKCGGKGAKTLGCGCVLDFAGTVVYPAPGCKKGEASKAAARVPLLSSSLAGSFRDPVPDPLGLRGRLPPLYRDQWRDRMDNLRAAERQREQAGGIYNAEFMRRNSPPRYP